MKKKDKVFGLIVFLIIQLFLNNFASAGNGENSPLEEDKRPICVISFMNPHHIYNVVIDKIIKKAEYPEKVNFVKSAIPMDILECLKKDVSEITIIGHSINIKEDNRYGGLFYFSKRKERHLPVPRHIFRKIFEDVNSRENHPLKSIRFIACKKSEIEKRYSYIADLEEEDINIQYSPRKYIPQFINHLATRSLDATELSTLDINWLKESFQYHVDNDSSKSFFAYVKMKTMFVYRSGKAEILRGKYSVRMMGLGLGLETKHKLIWIPYEEVEDLEVGESKSIKLFSFDFSLSVSTLGVDLQANGEDKFRGLLSQTDPDAFGVSVGIFTTTTITRNY